MISNLPRELVEKILSRVPVKKIPAVRSTCKTWNLISKDERFVNKHIEKQQQQEKRSTLIMIRDSMNYLSSFNLYETHNNNFGLSINPKSISSALPISEVFLSNGLLLCVWRNNRTRLLVWNLYWGKRRWIECPTHCWNERFAFGYDKSCGSHKILRFSNHGDLEIYDLSSDSWRTLNVDININTIYHIETGLSLKGNTYWCARDYEDIVLDCFDFTRERFGPGLPLPCHSIVSLSSIKEEKLAVLVSLPDTFEADIWITDNIDPYTVSWSKFLKVRTTSHIDNCFRYGGKFFIDEEKVFVVFSTYDNACYITSGENGHFREVYPRESSYKRPYRLVGCYVPSSVQI